MNKKLFLTAREVECMDWEAESFLLEQATEQGFISPSQWNDGDYDIVNILEQLGWTVLD